MYFYLHHQLSLKAIVVDIVHLVRFGYLTVNLVKKWTNDYFVDVAILKFRSLAAVVIQTGQHEGLMVPWPARHFQEVYSHYLWNNEKMMAGKMTTSKMKMKNRRRRLMRIIPLKNWEKKNMFEIATISPQYLT